MCELNVEHYELTMVDSDFTLRVVGTRERLLFIIVVFVFLERNAYIHCVQFGELGHMHIPMIT